MFLTLLPSKQLIELIRFKNSHGLTPADQRPAQPKTNMKVIQ